MKTQFETKASPRKPIATALGSAMGSPASEEIGGSIDQPSVFKEPKKGARGTGEIDVGALRLPQNFGESFAVRKLTTRVPVRKPAKTDFFRVRAGEEWRFPTMILEIKQEGETYLLSQDVWDSVPELVKPAMIHCAIDRRNNPFLIPVPLPGEDGRRNSWHESLAEIVAVAETKWARMSANQRIGGYDVLVAASALIEPEWPDLTLDDLVRIAFRGRVIDSVDHPVVRQLMGIC